jgi:ABC-type amino acid transport substrate-binding protein
LVGFDIEMAHELANELGVKLEFYLLDRDKFPEQLNAGYCDIIMSGSRITPRRATKMSFSDSYLDETLALIVRDHRRDKFSTREAIKGLESLKIGVVDDPYTIRMSLNYLPKAKIVKLKSPRDFFRKKGKDLDAMLVTAEMGSAWTLLYPEYSVVVPQPDVVSIPLAYPVSRGDQKMLAFVNSWLDLKKKDRSVEILFNHWILGQGAKEDKPRWSIIRDVLHWID